VTEYEENSRKYSSLQILREIGFIFSRFRRINTICDTFSSRFSVKSTWMNCQFHFIYIMCKCNQQKRLKMDALSHTILSWKCNQINTLNALISRKNGVRKFAQFPQCEKLKFPLTKKKYFVKSPRHITSLLITLLSRNFCENCVQVDFCNFYTVIFTHTHHHYVCQNNKFSWNQIYIINAKWKMKNVVFT